MNKHAVRYWLIFSLSLAAILAVWLPSFISRAQHFGEALHQETSAPPKSVSDKWKPIEQSLNQSLTDIQKQLRKDALPPSPTQ